MSALQGDNVVDGSENMPWYDGLPLLEHLESIELAFDRNLDARRFPVQWVIRPMSDEHHDYRGYAGTVAGGVWSAGDEVVVLPAGLRTRVEAVETADGPLGEAVPPQSVTIRLADDVDVSRGNLLADPDRPPIVARELEARVCWMSERPLESRAKLAVEQSFRTVDLPGPRGAIVDASTAQDYPGFDVATSFTLTTDQSGSVQLVAGNGDFFWDKLSPVGVINHL